MKFLSALVTLMLFSTCLGKAPFNLDDASARAGHLTREAPCPDEVAIAPCLCSVDAEEAMTLDCSAVESEDQLAAIFQQDFPSKAFRTLYLNNNYVITTIGDIFNGVTFVEFVVTNVLNLVSISDAAFTASVDTLERRFLSNTAIDETGLPLASLSDYSVLRELALLTTQVTNLSPLQSDSLEELRIFNSPVSTFAAGTFDGIPNLKRLEIGNCRLSTLFSGSVPITNSNYSVYLYHNTIDTLEAGAFVMPAETDSLSIYLNLAQNDITVLEESVFGEVFPYVSEFVIFGNALECGCDMAWLVTNPDYLSKVDAAAACANYVKVSDLDPNYYLENC